MGNRGNRTARRNTQRAACKGWSRDAANRNADFLESVDWRAIEQDAGALLIALSLTTRACPSSPADWQAGVNAFLLAASRLGCRAYHRLTEWTKNDRPHLHGVMLFDAGPDDYIRGVSVQAVRAGFLCRDLRDAWLRIANGRGWRVLDIAQHVQPATGALGWSDYLTKHGSRSVSNYQRSDAHIPPTWAGKTGRMWGRSRDGWPVVEEVKQDLAPRVRVLLRRAARGFERSRARQALARAQADLARHEDRAARGLGISAKTGEQIAGRLRAALAWVRSTRKIGQPGQLSDEDRKYWRGLGLNPDGRAGRAEIHRRRASFLGTRTSLSKAGQDRLLVYAETRPQMDDYQRRADRARTHTPYRLTGGTQDVTIRGGDEQAA